tara:strand:+ start:247 stop:558 length:312 start_codon:yes stop_codon:yes gene_type:complete
MLLVIFEVTMKPNKGDEYFDLAEQLQTELEQFDGFIEVKRFRSLRNTRKYVSISSWRDDASVRAWKVHVDHRQAQERGRREIFADFHISVAEVIRDYHMADTT